VLSDPLGLFFAELGRLALLDRAEKELRRRGYRLVAGVDEAGRGSLAGPVVAAAVILPDDCVLPGLDDSKRVEAECRERLAARVRQCAIAVGIGVVGAREIDLDDILRASLAAMKRAIEALDPPPDALLLDAVAVPGVRRPQLPIIHGDALCSSIAAASIVAKVHRDRLLDELGRRFPVYGFEQHKGYGVPEHWEALRLYGPCPEHRLTYHGVVLGPGDVLAPAGNAQPDPRKTRRRRGRRQGVPDAPFPIPG
jgi:ribonuclease HII